MAMLFSVRMMCHAAAWALISTIVLAAEVKPRTALVIGNARYENSVGALRNSSNDARAVAKTLRQLGFSVIERHDVTRDQLLKAVLAFRSTLAAAEVGLFYFAGHGISLSGANYLIPIKSGYTPDSSDDVALRLLAETRLFNVEQAVAEMKAAGARCNILILDACRTNALARNPRTRDAGNRGGLVEMTPPAGSLIAFAADAGQTAFDGDGTNGLYTEELLKNLRTPGLTIEQVFKRTRAAVLDRSGGGQIPAEYSRLVGEDIFLAGTALDATSAVTTEVPTPVMKTEAVAPPSAAAILKLAESGKAAECVSALRATARSKGPGDYSAAPLSLLLDSVKDDLKTATTPSPRVVAAVNTCELILQLIPECLPTEHERFRALKAKAHNRRGDALLILGRAKEALADFDTAQPLAPDDAYVLYNRARAHLALGQTDQARADFTEAASPRFNQPTARKLAQKALAELK